MNASRQDSGRPGGFTLVELLVSMAVLTLLVALVAQLVDRSAQAIAGSGRHMDTDTEARLVFNRLAADFARALKRTDLDYSPFKQPAGELGASYNNAAFNVNLQGGNDQFAIYSATEGYYSGSGAAQPTGVQRGPVSLVAYMVDTDPYASRLPNNTRPPVLRRLGKGLGWEQDVPAGGNPPVRNVGFLPTLITGATSVTTSSYGQWPNLFLPSTDPNADADFKTVGSQVFRFEYTYLLKASATLPARLSVTPWDTTATLNPLHTSINGFQDVAAVVVTLAMLDAGSRLLVADYAKLTGTTLFADARDPASDTVYKGDIAAAWNAQINRAGFAAAAGIPARAAGGVRVYQRYFYLDTQK